MPLTKTAYLPSAKARLADAKRVMPQSDSLRQLEMSSTSSWSQI
jgi:hypothetical protein